jgi:adenylate kinase
MILILLGLPGSGKGTQAELLAKKYGLRLFQTGDFARELASNDSRIKKIVESGGLIPEEEMTRYVYQKLDTDYSDAENILFEGFPRFVVQYEKLVSWLKAKNKKIDAIIFLNLTEEEVIKRLSSRRICSKCSKVYNLVTNPPINGKCECGGDLIIRSDDNEESIKTRFSAYKKATGKLVEYLDKKGELIKINAAKPIDDIFQDIVEKLTERGLVN